jgi:hypothetical protein
MLINQRTVSLVEYRTDKDWLAELPTQDWLCILVINEKHRVYLDELLPKLLLRNVAWVCTIGRECEWAHDLLDEEIVVREVAGLYLPPHQIMTTWHDDFEEGIWFALFAAQGDQEALKQVAIVDLTQGQERERVIAYLHSLQAQ